MDYKALRQQANLTQGQVAIAIGVPKRTVERWDSGKVQPTGGHTLALLKLYGQLKPANDIRLTDSAD